MNPVRENYMWYTYIIQSNKSKRWYTGCTADLRTRFREHNEELVFSTKGRGMFILIYIMRHALIKLMLLPVKDI